MVFVERWVISAWAPLVRVVDRVSASCRLFVAWRGNHWGISRATYATSRVASMGRRNDTRHWLGAEITEITSMQSDTRTKTFNSLPEASEVTHWTEEIARVMGFSSVTASRMLSAVLHALHSHVPHKDADRLGSQLPAFARDLYYGSDYIDAQHKSSSESFLKSVATACPEITGDQVERAIWSVFTILSHHVSPEVIREVRGLLPESIRALWNTAA
jgi:uncharacterized protein (DUF2267 family)